MSFIDYFAWFILIVLLATAVAIFVAMAVRHRDTSPRNVDIRGPARSKLQVG